jgi:hypothetical protein
MIVNVTDEMEPENREEGTDSLAQNYANNTPGQTSVVSFKEFCREVDNG